MFRHRTGTSSGALAMARYVLGETLKPENEALAKYYAGETIPHDLSGMEHLGRSIAQGETPFSVALDELTSAHIAMFGAPHDIDALTERLSCELLQMIDRAEARESVAGEGGTVARVREDMDPRLAQRLGIDMARPLTQAELARLLGGLRADGERIEGKQIQRPMKSVVEVFGLDAKRLPTPDEIDRILTSQRSDGAPSRSAEGNGAPFSDMVVEGARKRFLAAYGMPSQTELGPEHIEQIKAGRSATGRFLDEGDVLRKLNATKSPLTYTDCIWSADKSVSVAWALAPTEAERQIIILAHRDAVAASMAYLESHLGFTKRGKAGRDGLEPGVTTWVTADHYTSRPTAEIAMTSKDGERYTEFETIPMRTPDPQIHSHALLLNAVLTESGHIGSMDLDMLDGLVKQLGGIYQARLGRNLREAGINASLDPKTGAARIRDVPEFAVDHFSKRSRDIQAAARRYAKEEGLDWDTMSGAHQIKFLRRGVEETRNQKREHDGDSDFTSWRKQASEEIGYHHRSVLRPGQEQGLRSEDIRHRVAYEVSLPLIEEALRGKAKLDAAEFREYAIRGLVEAGIGDNPDRDIKAIMGMYREHGVRQDGEMVRIVFGKDVPVRGKDRWSVTTERHIEDEQAVVSLAQKLAVDRSMSFSHSALERASKEFLKQNPGVDPNSTQWIKQREVIETLGTGGKLGVAIGVAGAGKSTLMAPIVAAAKDDERTVYGISRGWKQANALSDAGVDRKDTSAISVFLAREAKGKVRLDSKTLIVIDELSQVSRDDMLKLLRLQAAHGFTLYGIGDQKQIGSIEAPVMDLLVKTLGDKVPQILTSVRQATEREREIAGLFRDGQANEAIQMKLEDGTAELVAGGRVATIQRVAAKWFELSAADPTSTPTIGVTTNRDAHDIGTAVRQRLQEAGVVGPNKIALGVLMRGEAGVQKISLAEGDRVRVFNRVWIKEDGLGHFASNGDVIDVLDVSEKGMRARNAEGKEATITWDKLTDRYDTAPRLAYGHALTIDASQGTTSRRHIDAVLSGSWHHQGGKGYVNESRQIEATHMIVNEAAERRKIFSHVPRGEHRIVRDDDIWKHVADNMNRPTTKASALDFLRDMTLSFRGNLTALPAGMEPAERRQMMGPEQTAIRHRIDRFRAELSPAIQEIGDLPHQVQQRFQPQLDRDYER
jgi:hypothetical protein